jgi:hypothetical protein
MFAGFFIGLIAALVGLVYICTDDGDDFDEKKEQ